jgi:hypothetical protein
MKLYRINYPTHGDDSLLAVEYAPTKREAAMLAKDGSGSFQQIDVPTDKTGLIKFLNQHTR